MSAPRSQAGYDAMADLYAQVTPSAYQFPVERHAAAAFIEAAQARTGIVVDVGCGTGHVAADLAAHGVHVVGCDPSPAMLTHARRAYPALTFVDADAGTSLSAVDALAGAPGTPGSAAIAAIIARFSLIHVEPADVAEILASWATRVPAGTPVLVAFQASDEPGDPLPFDHAVAPAWRWHPDEFSRVLRVNGFAEDWRLVYRDASYRFPMAHLLATRT